MPRNPAHAILLLLTLMIVPGTALFVLGAWLSGELNWDAIRLLLGIYAFYGMLAALLVGYGIWQNRRTPKA